MAKGFFKGALWGTVASAGALTVVSLLQGAPRVAEEVVVRPPVLQAPEPPATTSSVDPSVQRMSAPEPDTLSDVSAETLAPVDIPSADLGAGLERAAVPENITSGAFEAPPAPAPSISFNTQGALQSPNVDAAVSMETGQAQPSVQAPATLTPQEEGRAPDVIQESDIDTGRFVPRTATAPPSIAPSPVQPKLPTSPVEAPSFANPVTDTALPEGAVSDPNADISNAPDVQDQAPAAPQPDSEGASLPDPLEVASAAVDMPAQPQAPAVATESPMLEASDPVAPQRTGVTDLPAPQTPQQMTIQQNSGSVRVEAAFSIVAPVATPPEPVKAPSIVVEIGPPARARGIVAMPDALAPDPNRTKTPEDPAPVAGDVTPVVPRAPFVAPVSEQTPSSDVRVNRLPTLGGAIEDASEIPATDPAIDLSEVEAVSPLRPIDQFAASFENLDSKPLMAIVLMDDGVNPVTRIDGLSALQDLPYPVSLAVDALLPDAAERMKIYRAAGFEVLASVNLPDRAAASDAEVSLSVALETMQEVVAVLDGVTTGVQTTPDAGRQVGQILAQTGHGLIMQSKGLNTAQKLAARSGVPSAVVFRDIDSQGQSRTVIRRFLDQAAFRAGRDGSVVMLGRLRGETLAALAMWTQQDRAATVAMSPVSAVLKSQ